MLRSVAGPADVPVNASDNAGHKLLLTGDMSRYTYSLSLADQEDKR
ncbi:hypothetical protein P7T05_11455 [Pantoea anthophila]|nr:hypothetical protein [Pantoea anthophila]WIM53160.1 hypothetical protein P7T05_11455 [Pantoea anthophila]